MALIINSSENKKIEIPGIDLELEQLYIRLEFACRADGKTVEVAFLQFKDKGKFKDGKQCITTVPTGNIRLELEEGEKQDLETIHNICKQHFEQLGYKVTITDLN